MIGDQRQPSRTVFISEPAQQALVALRNIISDSGLRWSELLWLFFVFGFLFFLMIRALVLVG